MPWEFLQSRRAGIIANVASGLMIYPLGLRLFDPRATRYSISCDPISSFFCHTKWEGKLLNSHHLYSGRQTRQLVPLHDPDPSARRWASFAFRHHKLPSARVRQARACLLYRWTTFFSSSLSSAAVFTSWSTEFIFPPRNSARWIDSDRAIRSRAVRFVVSACWSIQGLNNWFLYGVARHCSSFWLLLMDIHLATN